MKIGIMQPYFFPYIGYFQLIHAVDTYIVLDHVNFMKRSYMTRNQLKNNTSINIPVYKGSQNVPCRETMVISDNEWFNKFEKTLETLYKKSPYYDIVIEEIYKPWKFNIQLLNNVENRLVSISEFNFTSIYYICKYLDCERKFYSSAGTTENKLNKGLQDIVKHYKATTYINAIGGQKLYTKEDFASQGIDLKFIKMENMDIENPYASMLDLLFNYSKDHLKEQLTKYTLI